MLLTYIYIQKFPKLPPAHKIISARHTVDLFSIVEKFGAYTGLFIHVLLAATPVDTVSPYHYWPN